MTNRVVAGNAQPRDLAAIRITLQQLPSLHENLPGGETALTPILNDLHICVDELALLESSLADDPPATLHTVGVIRPGYSAELDGVLERSRHAREWIANLEVSRTPEDWH